MVFKTTLHIRGYYINQQVSRENGKIWKKDYCLEARSISEQSVYKNKLAKFELKRKILFKE